MRDSRCERNGQQRGRCLRLRFGEQVSLELATETFDGGLFDWLVISQVYQDGGELNGVDGRWGGVIAGSSGDPDALYAAAYGYDAFGRLDHVVGPGLPTGDGEDNGAWYTFLTGGSPGYTRLSDMVHRLRFKNDGGDVLGWTEWSYDADRDLLTAVENNFGDLTTYDTLSKYAYGNDSRGRREHVIRTGAAFVGGSENHHDRWGYNDRNELSGSLRYANTDSEDETPEDAVDALNFDYAYDPIGNRVTHAAGDAPDEGDYTANGLTSTSGWT